MTSPKSDPAARPRRVMAMAHDEPPGEPTGPDEPDEPGEPGEPTGLTSPTSPSRSTSASART